jgi:hypothetical protein
MLDVYDTLDGTRDSSVHVGSVCFVQEMRKKEMELIREPFAMRWTAQGQSAVYAFSGWCWPTLHPTIWTMPYRRS